jgi:ferric-dicitrate binding protein FerR (iron transport regulator)
MLDRYFAGECASNEQAMIDTWLEAHPKERARITIIRHAARYPTMTLPVPASSEIWTTFKEHLHLADADHAALARVEGTRSRRVLDRARSWRSWSVASVAVAAVVLIAVWLIQLPQKHAAVRHASNVYVTPKGDQAKILLADGTTVMLNVASRLEIPQSFDEHHRIVRLYGEAAFQVARTTGAPFVVEAGGMHTRVLGTEFSIRAYQPHDLRVAVRTGKVAVESTVLSAHDIAYTERAGHVVVSRHQDVDAAFAFTHGQLVLGNRTFQKAIDDLDRWYDVDIRLGDAAIGDMPIHAVLVSGSMGDLIGFLQQLYDVRVVRDGRTLTLYQR